MQRSSTIIEILKLLKVDGNLVSFNPLGSTGLSWKSHPWLRNTGLGGMIISSMGKIFRDVSMSSLVR